MSDGDIHCVERDIDRMARFTEPVLAGRHAPRRSP